MRMPRNLRPSPKVSGAICRALMFGLRKCPTWRNAATGPSGPGAPGQFGGISNVVAPKTISAIRQSFEPDGPMIGGFLRIVICVFLFLR